ncbi:hypothetical protein Heshes_04140 [Alicyclobacillus hesperidum]|uniref:Uncharacterized protein n=1 Tax=Alicyclobacillus hesperidum TaxID=89784 RepID=A0AA37TWN5_9BACL|nr:hypothetical protein Heshes_04140 [Alicyclobacillus hesperidum]
MPSAKFRLGQKHKIAFYIDKTDTFVEGLGISAPPWHIQHKKYTEGLSETGTALLCMITRLQWSPQPVFAEHTQPAYA